MYFVSHRDDHSPDTGKSKKPIKKMGGLFHKNKAKDEDKQKKEDKKEEPASGKKRYVLIHLH